MDRSRTLAGFWLIAALAAGCGGRDALLGEPDPAFDPPAPRADAAVARDGARDTGTSVTPPNPVPIRDGGTVVTPPPPQPIRDAGSVTPPAMAGCMFPACLEKLKFNCLPAGTCTQNGQRRGPSGTALSNICYSNGVKFVPTASDNRTSTTVVTRADGTVCYTRVLEPRGAGVTGINYLAPGNGDLIASAIVQGDNLHITCAGQVNPMTVPSRCEPGVRNNDVMCPTGQCQ